MHKRFSRYTVSEEEKSGIREYAKAIRNYFNNTLHIFPFAMAFTSRERNILKSLKDGKLMYEIAEEQKTSPSSISGSIVRIKSKMLDFMDDMEYLLNLGIIKIKKGRPIFVVRDPKSLREKDKF